MTTTRPTAALHPFPGGTTALRDSARLDALARAGLLDTPEEPAVDRSVRLATRLLGGPVALVSLVDAERQFSRRRPGSPNRRPARD